MLVLWLMTVVVPVTLALDNGLVLTPPMGWLSWLEFGCNIDCDVEPKKCLSEDLIKRTADKMVSDGYRDAGYEYVIIDDCWLEKERDANGRMVPDRKRFKSGMKALADYLHERKLKFGMYQSIGTQTCQGYPGEEGHEDIDIQTFVEWGIDYLKLDGCGSSYDKFVKSYPAYGQKLNTTGRSIVYSCSWPAYNSENMDDYPIINKTCNLWRNYGDISASWSSIENIMDWFAEHQDKLIPSAGPGHWNDPDMLVVGNKAVNPFHSGIQMKVWSFLSAPLMMSVDLDTILPKYKKILLDKYSISIDQDPLGMQGKRTFKNASLELWTKNGSNNTYWALFIKHDLEEYQSEITFEHLNLPEDIYTIKDVYEDTPAVTMKWAPGSVIQLDVGTKERIKVYSFKPAREEKKYHQEAGNEDYDNVPDKVVLK